MSSKIIIPNAVRRIEKYLAEVYGKFPEGFDTPDLREARALWEALPRRQDVGSRRWRKRV
jgi:predicted ATPase